MLTGWTISAGFSRSFNLPEFDRFQLSAALPLWEWTAGAWTSGFGRELYAERTLGLNVSHPLLMNLYAGLGLQLSQIELKNYGSDQAVGTDIGFFWQRRSLSAGLAVNNLVSTAMDRFANEHVPRRTLLSGRWSHDSTLTLLLEGVFQENHDPAIRAGIESWLFDALAVRAGYDSGSGRFHLGIAIAWQGFSAQGAYDHHPWLGWSHAFGLEWRQRPLPR